MLNLAYTAYVIRYLLQDEDMDIQFKKDKIIFNIYDICVTTDGFSYFTIDSKKISISNIYELFQYILVQITKQDGFTRYSKIVYTIDELPGNEANTIKRLSSNEILSTPDKILQDVTFLNGTPEYISSITRVPKRVIRKIRLYNREKILQNAFKEANKILLDIRKNND